MKYHFLLLLILVFFFMFFFLIITLDFESLGGSPSEQDKEKFSKSPYFDSEKKRFINRQETKVHDMRKRFFTFSFFKKTITKGPTKPSVPIPQKKPQMKTFLEDPHTLKVIWLGHSSLLLSFSGKTILIDPVFERASPLFFIGNPFQSASMQREDLPHIDYLLLSHDHYDHLEKKTIQFFQDKKTHIIAPLGLSSHLTKWGIPNHRITERDWWESISFDHLKFIATPAQHYSGRKGSFENQTLWASWIIQSPQYKVYYSGDSGYDIHFKKIGNEYGPFDLAFLETGQYNVTWREIHMLPDEGVQAYADLRAKRYFPIHWGRYALAFHTWDDPIQQLFQFHQEHIIELIAPQMGEVFDLQKPFELKKWWIFKDSKNTQ